MDTSKEQPPFWKRFGWRQMTVLVPLCLACFALAFSQLLPAVGFVLIGISTSLTWLPLSLNPLTLKKIKRFKSIRRGYLSFLVLALLTILSLFAEVIANNRALVVNHDGKWYFPVYGHVLLGAEFGLTGADGASPVNYRLLQERFQESGQGFVLLPPIPYSPNENLSINGVLRPQAPDSATSHYLGTDGTGRDILSRLIYGFRITIFFALAFTLLVYLIGVTLGCLMGYFGGWFDLSIQRLIEIWSLVPFLYIVIIVFSILPTSLPVWIRIASLLLIMVLFSWTSLTYYMRSATYREKARDYVASARVIGAGTRRIIFTHILPNAISTIVTFMPFMMASAITAITALDFLGFGLPPPTPSLGEMLKQGSSNLNAIWIISSAFTSLVFILVLVTFIGEALREAFEPRKFTYFK